MSKTLFVKFKYNEIMKNKIRAKLKYMLYSRGLTITRLAEMMTEKTGEKYTFQRISHKLRLGRLTLIEAYIIADLLNFELDFIEKD